MIFSERGVFVMINLFVLTLTIFIIGGIMEYIEEINCSTYRNLVEEYKKWKKVKLLKGLHHVP